MKIEEIERSQSKWLVTGAAGFIGSHLVEGLLKLGQRVVGLDNFATGFKGNLEQAVDGRSAEERGRFEFMEGDIRDLAVCKRACAGADYVLHQAALGSVPRSINDPITSNGANVDGFLNMLVAARDAKVKRFVYASSSSVYGDSPVLPKKEEEIGNPLSPYAVTKRVNELYADVFTRNYGISTVGLRYFNVFGPRQDPNGPYAAVIPRWVSAMQKNEPAYINGNGSTSRDFCYIENVVQANLRAAISEKVEGGSQVFNIAFNARTTLNELFEMIRQTLLPACPHLANYKAIYQPYRPGDIAHSHADISKARAQLDYQPKISVKQGLEIMLRK